MRSIRMVAAAATLAIAAAVASTAGAEDQPAPHDSMMGAPHGMMMDGAMEPGMTHGGAGPGMTGGGGSGHAMCGAMAGHIDGRLAYVKAELKISEAQESLWNSYAAAARDNASSMLAHCTTMMSLHGGSTVSLPDRLDQHEQLMTAHLEAMSAMNKALKSLYAGLSDSQKHAADELFWGPMGMM
jgi:LTXXQ motif family protein